MEFYSNGKLLITGEYLVLDGAESLALPTKQGQYLTVNEGFEKANNILVWESLDLNNEIWFSANFQLPSLNIISSTNTTISETLSQIFLEVRKVNPLFLIQENNVLVQTNLTFEINWGLGTSSTLINNIASWAQVNPFDLQFAIFGGSAYDIACAKTNQAIIYKLDNDKPIIESIIFDPPFKENLFFIHLNKKQNSRDAIETYRRNLLDKKQAITDVTAITKKMLVAKTLIEFEQLIKKHEDIISKFLGLVPIKKHLFADYSGEIKSLGAWGGDFILATGNSNTLSYFNEKGYNTVLSYKDIILEKQN